jgi:hypothetical protein
MRENELSKIVIGCGLKVHSALGPGLLESAYTACLHYDLLRILCVLCGPSWFVKKTKPLRTQRMRKERQDLWIDRRLRNLSWTH